MSPSSTLESLMMKRDEMRESERRNFGTVRNRPSLGDPKNSQADNLALVGALVSEPSQGNQASVNTEKGKCRAGKHASGRSLGCFCQPDWTLSLGLR